MKLFRRLLGCVAMIWLALLLCQTRAETTQEQHYKFFKNYDPMVRPSVNGFGTPTPVEISVSIRQLGSIDETDELTTFTLRITALYQDYRLTYNKSEIGLNSLSDWNRKDVWSPPFYIIEEVENPIYLYRAYAVNTSGHVWVGSTGKSRYACPLDTTYFPYDTQVCQLNMALEGQFDRDVNITHATGGIYLYKGVETPNQQWSLTELALCRVDQPYGPGSMLEGRTRQYIELKIGYKRNPRYYQMNVLMPSCGIAFLIPLIFLIPIESGERIGLAITVQLAYVVFQLFISENTPKSSKSFPIAQSLILTMSMVTGVAIIASIIMMNMVDGRVRRLVNRLSFCTGLLFAIIITIQLFWVIPAYVPAPSFAC